MRTDDFLAFLEYLVRAYPQGPILFSSHTIHAVSAWQETHPRLRFDYLPMYCSHVNPVERIWLQLKNALAANRLYPSMRVLLETVEAFFTAMTPEQALTWGAA